MTQKRIRKARQKARKRVDDANAEETSGSSSKAVTRARKVSANAKRFLERTSNA